MSNTLVSSLVQPSTGSSPHLHAPRDPAPGSQAQVDSGFGRFFTRKRKQIQPAGVPGQPGIDLNAIIPASARRRRTGPLHDVPAAQTAAAAQPPPQEAAAARR
jgi:hypothetical protein